MMKTYTLVTLLLSSATAFPHTKRQQPAVNPSCCGFQSIFLGTRSDDSRYNDKAISNMNQDLSVGGMYGSGGIQTGTYAPWGWNEETGQLAMKKTKAVSDEAPAPAGEMPYGWVPLSLQVSAKTDTLPTSGLGKSKFVPEGVMPIPTYQPTLAADGDKIGMKAEDGSFVSKWFACNDKGTGTALQWSFGDSPPEDQSCVAVEVYKVDNKPESTATSSAAPTSSATSAPRPTSKPVISVVPAPEVGWDVFLMHRIFAFKPNLPLPSWLRPLEAADK